MKLTQSEPQSFSEEIMHLTTTNINSVHRLTPTLLVNLKCELCRGCSRLHPKVWNKGSRRSNG